MGKFRAHFCLICFLILSFFCTITAAQQPLNDQGPANVAGTWTIYSKSDDGKTSEKTIELKQEGSNITGHFKGPNQSGGLEGTVEGWHIVFHTKTRAVFTFRGQVDGDTIHGNWGLHEPKKGEMHGTWEARRSQ